MTHRGPFQPLPFCDSLQHGAQAKLLGALIINNNNK